MDRRFVHDVESCSFMQTTLGASASHATFSQANIHQAAQPLL